MWWYHFSSLEELCHCCRGGSLTMNTNSHQGELLLCAPSPRTAAPAQAAKCSPWFGSNLTACAAAEEEGLLWTTFSLRWVWRASTLLLHCLDSIIADRHFPMWGRFFLASVKYALPHFKTTKEGRWRSKTAHQPTVYNTNTTLWPSVTCSLLYLRRCGSLV